GSSTLVNLENLWRLMRPFITLHTFTLEQDMYSAQTRALRPALEFRRFNLWKETCPSLISVSLFGDVLSVA
ncbi:hypothetical protein FRC08_003343, partial [Ceratobasidium sp. 394]